MSEFVARIAALLGRESHHAGESRATESAPVTLRDPAWLVRASGWAPVHADSERR